MSSRKQRCVPCLVSFFGLPLPVSAAIMTLTNHTSACCREAADQADEAEDDWENAADSTPRPALQTSASSSERKKYTADFLKTRQEEPECQPLPAIHDYHELIQADWRHGPGPMVSSISQHTASFALHSSTTQSLCMNSQIRLQLLTMLPW